MLIKKVEIWNWKGIDHLVVGDLSPGLNLIKGPNRSGKSRVQEAIQFAFMESSKGQATHKKMLPTRGSSEGAKVQVTFEQDGTTYTITKKYMKGQGTVLAGGGKTLEDDEAEDRLQELMGTSVSSRTQASVSDMGIWPLLWSPQDAARSDINDAFNQVSRNALQDTLSKLAGVAMVSAAGHALMAKVRAQYEEHFTKTGAERPAFKAERDEVQAAIAECDAATRRIADNYAKVDQLTASRKDLASVDSRLQEILRKAEQAKQAAQAAEQARHARKAAEGEVALRQLEVTNAAEAVRRRAEQDGKLAKLRESIGALTAARDASAADVTTQAGYLTDTEKAVSAASAAQARATEVLGHAHQAARREEFKRTLAERSPMLERAAAATAQIRDLDRQRGALQLFTSKALQHLRELDRAASEAAFALSASAVKVRVSAKVSVRAAGAERAPGTHELEITAPTDIAIGDVATLTVAPGAGDIREKAKHAAEARAEFDRALATLGVANLAQAETKHGDLADVDRKLEAAKAQLSATAPKGLAALETEVAGLEGKIAAIVVPDGTPAAPAAEESAQAARSAFDEAREREHQARRRHGDSLHAKAAAEQALKHSQDEVAAMESSLAGQPSPDDLKQAKVDADEALMAARVQVAAAEEAYKKAGGADAEAEAKRTQQAVASLQQSRDRLTTECAKLEGEVSAAAREGAYDKLQDAQGKLELLRAKLARRERAAAAAKLLWESLEAKRQSLQQAVAAPLITKVGRYLEHFFEGCQLHLTEDLQFTGIRGDNQEEGFSELSGGEREQMVLAVRLALAEVLKGDRPRLPVILDDSLVSTSDDRLEAVHRVLYTASQGLQVLVFTCQGERFDTMGAEYTQSLAPRPRRRAAA